MLQPWAAWSAGLLRLRLAVVAALPLVLLFLCSGADRQAAGAQGGAVGGKIHTIHQPPVDPAPATPSPAGGASSGRGTGGHPSSPPTPRPPVEDHGAPAAPTPGEPERDVSPPGADAGVEPPPGIGGQFKGQPVREVPGAGRWVALTFDDGPVPGWTERYLRALEAAGAPATFFMVGRQAEAYPALVKAVQAGGHQVASHSWRHADLSKATREAIEEDLLRTATVLQAITGRPVEYFRPPYGAVGPNLMAVAAKLELKMVTWNIDPRDWSRPAPEVIIEHVMSRIGDGNIILLHESLSGTLAALPRLIERLRSQGYELVTVSDLMTCSSAAAAK